MSFILITVAMSAALLSVERLLRLGRRGRRVLAVLVLIWAVVDAVWSAQENSGHRLVTFTISFLDSLVPLVLWQWISAWIRKKKERPAGLIAPEALAPTEDRADDDPKVTMDGGYSPCSEISEGTKQIWGNSVVTISADAAKLLFPEYLEDPLGNDQRVASSARAVSDAALATILGTRPGPGRDVALICVGAPASGKTSTLASQSDPAVDLKIEETLNDLEAARSLVQSLIDSGRRPVILWLYVDHPSKLVDRMVSRARRIGRAERLDEMSSAFVEVPKVLTTLKSDFAGQLKVHIADNSGARCQLKFIQDLDSAGSMLDNAIADRVGLAQVDATNRMFAENPEFEVPY